LLLFGRSLFVTLRGQLAEKRACGRMREVPATSCSMLDRAWQTLTDGLRQSPLIHP
jgi:hypothetical protein